MNNLEKVIATYLQYDQKSDDRWHDPSPANKDYHERVKKDAENIAKLAINVIETVPNKRHFSSFAMFIKKNYFFTDQKMYITCDIVEPLYACKKTDNIYTESEIITKWIIDYYGK